MAVLLDLFSSDVGLLSLFTLGFIVVMGLYLWYRLAKNSRELE
ncbi:MAG: DUF3149 domain-containing protein [Gallionellaceae bacterium]|nr:DUF3149 domain-containing protein [Gallionellaceae bacterium]MDD5363993.1 DUF3149 domain-containing protein [Gallionellaceae bacterium]